MKDHTKIKKIDFEEVKRFEKEICQGVQVTTELREQNAVLIGAMDLATKIPTH